MGLTARGNQDWTWYIPEVGGNREDPSPTRVEIRPMAPSLYTSWKSRMTARVGFAARRLEGAAGELDVDRLPDEAFDAPPEEIERILKYCVGEIENYTSIVREDGQQRSKPIRNARDLLHRGDPVVVFEVYAKIIALSSLTEVQVGNSTGRPGSSSPTPPAMSEDGSAPSATEPSDKPATATG